MVSKKRVSGQSINKFRSRHGIIRVQMVDIISSEFIILIIIYFHQDSNTFGTCKCYINKLYKANTTPKKTYQKHSGFAREEFTSRVHFGAVFDCEKFSSRALLLFQNRITHNV